MFFTNLEDLYMALIKFFFFFDTTWHLFRNINFEKGHISYEKLLVKKEAVETMIKVCGDAERAANGFYYSIAHDWTRQSRDIILLIHKSTCGILFLHIYTVSLAT